MDGAMNETFHEAEPRERLRVAVCEVVSNKTAKTRRKPVLPAREAPADPSENNRVKAKG